MMSGGDNSPSMERYRRLRADLLELQLKRECGELISKASVVENLAVFSSLMQRAFAEIRNRWGEEPYGLLEDALGEASRHFREAGKADHADAEEAQTPTSDSEG
jgi:hypothetical protein